MLSTNGMVTTWWIIHKNLNITVGMLELLIIFAALDNSRFFFSIGDFFHRHWWFTWLQGKGGDHRLFYSISSSRSWLLRHLFATLQARWLSRIFNRNACVYQTATRWDLPTYSIIDSLIDWWCTVFLRDLLILGFSYSNFDIGNQWICTHIDYHPFITSKPTNQVC